MADQLSVAQKSSGTMVVGMEEGKWLLLEDQEDGVNELEIFREVVHLHFVSCILSLRLTSQNSHSTE